MQISAEQLLSQLAQLERRYAELEEHLAPQASQSQREPKAYQALSKELSDLREIVTTYRTSVRIERDAAEADALFHAQGDFDMRELAKEEAVALRLQQTELLKQLERLWHERHQAPERP